MDKPRNNFSELRTAYFSFGDILALGLMLATGLYFIITSALNIAIMVSGNPDMVELLISIIGAIVGYGLVFGAYRFVKRSASLKSIADNLFVEALYDRLEPLLAEIAETKASYDILSDRLDNLNYNMNDIRKSIELGKSTPDLAPVQYAMKNVTYLFQYTLLMIVTLASYMFMFSNPGTLVPYLSPIVFVLWWALITSQHDLWELPRVWYWVAVPILFIPISTIVVAALTAPQIMLILIYLGLGAYAFLYYFWCEYTARGILPFGLGERMRNIRTMLEKPEAPEVKVEERRSVITPAHIGTIFIMLSILVFALTMMGYLIENELLNMSWQMLGLDISLQPIYFYGLVVLGVLLLVIGSIFVIKFRKYR